MSDTKFTLEYLQLLISDKIEENLHLEYKAAASIGRQNNITTEISKDVSSFANSDGGTIIYGIKEDTSYKHFPGNIDPINRNEFSKEWLEQIIQDKIKPRISNLKIHPIEITNDQVVYIVEVKKSNTAHQADDKRYYKRFNFQSVPMYDYEIRDILNRRKDPQITLFFEIESNTLKIYAHNIGSVYANYVNVKIRAPKNIVRDEYYKPFNRETYEIHGENTIRDVLDFKTTLSGLEPKYGPSRYDPILPTRKFLLVELKLFNNPFDYENILEWDIYCDNAEPISGQIRFADIFKSLL